jgi:glucan biosynthesis protein C
MPEQIGTDPPNRQLYLDNLRIYLTILVILHHATLTYGGSGAWVGGRDLVDPAVDAISSFLLPIFNCINQSYFMSAFFLLAGYFTPQSFDRKGSFQFLKDRLIRLGIPIIIYTTIIFNINEYMLGVFRGDLYRIRIRYEPGHLWFLKALIIFAVCYMIFRALADRIPSKKRIQLYRETFPPDAILFLCIAILSVLTFAVRLVFPVGVWFLRIQPGHFVHYIFCFYIGVLAYRGDWFHRLSKKQARRWGMMSLVVIPLLLVIGALGGAGEDAEKFAEFLLGGLHWQAFAYAVWESFLMVGIIVFLLCFLRETLNKAGPIAKSLAINVYTVYIIHQTILAAVQILFLRIDIPTILKFFFVSLIAVILCFSLSILIRRIPFARRVLG